MTTESDEEYTPDATEALTPGTEGAEAADPTIDTGGSETKNGGTDEGN